MKGLEDQHPEHGIGRSPATTECQRRLHHPRAACHDQHNIHHHQDPEDGVPGLGRADGTHSGSPLARRRALSAPESAGAETSPRRRCSTNQQQEIRDGARKRARPQPPARKPAEQKGGHDERGHRYNETLNNNTSRLRSTSARSALTQSSRRSLKDVRTHQHADAHAVSTLDTVPPERRSRGRLAAATQSRNPRTASANPKRSPRRSSLRANRRAATRVTRSEDTPTTALPAAATPPLPQRRVGHRRTRPCAPALRADPPRPRRGPVSTACATVHTRWHEKVRSSDSHAKPGIRNGHRSLLSGSNDCRPGFPAHPRSTTQPSDRPAPPKANSGDCYAAA